MVAALDAALGQRLAREALAVERGSRFGEGHADHRLRESVAGVHHVRAQAVGLEGLVEGADRSRAHGLGPVEGQAPAREVQAFAEGGWDPLEAAGVGEVGRHRQRPAVVADRPQPALRLTEEGHGRHQDEGDLPEDRPQEPADQAHVVIEREPGDHDVVPGHLRGLAAGANVGEERGVGHDDALGAPRRARGVLVEGDLAQAGARRAGRGELLDGQDLRDRTRSDPGQGLHERVQSPVGEADANPGVGHDVAETLEGDLGLLEGGRGIGGHGDRADQLEREEGLDEGQPGREDDQDSLVLRDPLSLEAAGQLPDALSELAVAPGLDRIALVVTEQGDPAGRGLAPSPSQSVKHGRGLAPAEGQGEGRDAGNAIAHEQL